MISNKQSMVVVRKSSLVILQSRLLSSSMPCLKISRRATMDKDMLLKEAKEFFGPKNIKGEHKYNKYYYPPQDNRPRYVVNDGKPLVGDQFKTKRPGKNFNNRERNPSVHPFPNNTYTKTAQLISDQMKDKIVEDATIKGMHPQEIAHKYGINLLRIEAILKLKEIELKFEPKVCINSNCLICY
ncbi:MAG: hypothetical protein M5E90_03880 [Asgard group archaeon]|nr:hypothetical protein [Asgard group archaeon]